jgi:hypothetical protein
MNTFNDAPGSPVFSPPFFAYSSISSIEHKGDGPTFLNRGGAPSDWERQRVDSEDDQGCR